MTLVNMILLVVALIILIGSVVMIKKGFDRNNPDDICAMSAAVSSVSASIGQGAHLVDFKCPVRQWTFRMGEMGEVELGEVDAKKDSYKGTTSGVVKKGEFVWYMPFVKTKKVDYDIKIGDAEQRTKQGVYKDILEQSQDTINNYRDAIRKDEKKYRVMDQQDFMNEQIAKRMYRCSTKLGEGKLNIFSKDFMGTAPTSYCIVCDIFDFSEISDLDNARANIDKKRDDLFSPILDNDNKLTVGRDCSTSPKDCYPYVNTLDDWMALWKIPGEDVTFYEYFKRINGDSGMFDEGQQFDYVMYAKKEGGDERENVEYAVVYLESNYPLFVQKLLDKYKGWTWKDSVSIGSAVILPGSIGKYIMLWQVFDTAVGEGGQKNKVLDRKIMYIPVRAISMFCDDVTNM
ncbi:MAG: hypothetical protein WC755_03410 [Candidatus Woesearchaeota archaeon]